MLPLIVGPALQELTGVRPGQPRVQRLGRPAVLDARPGRRRLRPARRLPHRPLRPAPRARLEHPPVRVLGPGRGLRHFRLVAARLPHARRSSACASSSWPRWPGWPSSSRTRKRREAVLGYTQAFSSIGGLLVTGAYYLAVTYGDSLPAMYGAHAPWRYTLMSGVIPALPLIIIRPFLPESPTWQAKKAGGDAQAAEPGRHLPGRPPAHDARDHPDVRVQPTAPRSARSSSCPRIVPGLEEVQGLPRPAQQKIVSAVQAWQEIGGLVGRFLLAYLAVRIVARRRLLRIFQVPGAGDPAARVPVRGAVRPRSRSSGGSSWAGSSRSRSSASGGTTCRACTPRTCAGRARASPPTSAGA